MPMPNFNRSYPHEYPLYHSPSYSPEVQSRHPIFSIPQRSSSMRDMGRGKAETKPRLAKEDVEILEATFQKQHKPSTATKKQLAERLDIDHRRLCVSRQPAIAFDEWHTNSKSELVPKPSCQSKGDA